MFFTFAGFGDFLHEKKTQFRNLKDIDTTKARLTLKIKTTTPKWSNQSFDSCRIISHTKNHCI